MKKRVKTLAVAASLILLMLLLTSAPVFDGFRFYRVPERAELANESVPLPTEIDCGMLFLSASVNNDSPNWFLMDTGAGVLILDQEVMRIDRAVRQDDAVIIHAGRDRHDM